MSSSEKSEDSPPNLKKVEAEETKSVEQHSGDESQEKPIQKVSPPQRSHGVDTLKNLLEDSSDTSEKDDSVLPRLGHSGSETKKLSTDAPLSRKSRESYLTWRSAFSHATPDEAGLEMAQLSPKSQSCRPKSPGSISRLSEGFQRMYIPDNLRTEPENIGEGSELKMDQPSPKSRRSRPKDRGEGVGETRSLRHTEPDGGEKETQPEMYRLSPKSRSCRPKVRGSIINQNEVEGIRSLRRIKPDDAKETEPEACRLSPKSKSCRRKVRSPIMDPIVRVGGIRGQQNMKGAEKEAELEARQLSPKPRRGRVEERLPRWRNWEVPDNYREQAIQLDNELNVDNAPKPKKMGKKARRKLKKSLAKEARGKYPKNEKGKPNRRRKATLLSQILDHSSSDDKEETESTSTDDGFSSAYETESDECETPKTPVDLPKPPVEDPEPMSTSSDES